MTDKRGQAVRNPRYDTTSYDTFPSRNKRMRDVKKVKDGNIDRPKNRDRSPQCASYHVRECATRTASTVHTTVHSSPKRKNAWWLGASRWTLSSSRMQAGGTTLDGYLLSHPNPGWILKLLITHRCSQSVRNSPLQPGVYDQIQP
jgi:hypothetical protein